MATYMLETGQGWILGPGNLEGAVWDPNAGSEIHAKFHLCSSPLKTLWFQCLAVAIRAWNINNNMELSYLLNCPKQAVKTLPGLGGLWEWLS